MKAKRKPKLDKTTRALLKQALETHPDLLQYLGGSNPKTMLIDTDYQVVTPQTNRRGA